MASTSHKKRKHCTSDTEPICIIHVPGLKYGPIQLMTNVKDPELKMEKLKEIKRRRMAEPQDSPYRLEESCRKLPDIIEEVHGFHRECYQRFTMNLNRLKEAETSSLPESRSTRRSSSDHIIFHADCIFCRSEARKKVKIQGSWTTEGLIDFEREGWKHVIDVAEVRNDETLLLRIRGHDLFACEAKFHRSCRNRYTQNPEKWRSDRLDEQERQREVEKAHQMAMAEVTKVVGKEIIAEKKIMKLSVLLKVYTNRLQDSPHPNPNFRSTNLKKKLEKYDAYQRSLGFCQMGDFQSYLVYNTQINVDSAVRKAYQLASEDTVALVGTQMHQSIQEAYNNSTEVKWPPTAQDLTNNQIVIPAEIERFLLYAITGKAVHTSARVHRLVQSIGQDIARVNYQVGIWKRAHIPKPDVPLAHNGHGWTQTDEHLEPLWYDGTMLPAQLSDLARTVAPGTVNDDDNDDDDDDDDDALMAENSTLDEDETDSDIE
uniref:uncharacterized protein n=1 Tax=Myxine glutinosa TaxID=7769 RepID=UPI00358EEDC6